MKIFHLVPKKKWQEIKKEKTNYAPESLREDGFIHCCKADQLEMVLRIFKTVEPLVLLRIDSEKVTAEIKIEYPREASLSALEFPHIYGELNLDSVEEEFVLFFEDGKYGVPGSVF